MPHKLFAISDLHVDYEDNKRALSKLPNFKNDWIILAGDIAETSDGLRYVFDIFCKRFAKVIWVPGNHDLWLREDNNYSDSVAKYKAFINICQEYQVTHPEDKYPIWQSHNEPYYIVPMNLLYDYSFRPAEVTEDQAIAWAQESGIMCNDEFFIDPGPYKSISAWCHDQVSKTEQRLKALDPNTPLILINHYPLRQDLVRLHKIPRFSLWCGTKLTENWHQKFPVAVAINGHLHMRATDFRDGVRFEEVSLGYPQHWQQQKGVTHYLRQILPTTMTNLESSKKPIWHF